MVDLRQSDDLAAIGAVPVKVIDALYRRFSWSRVQLTYVWRHGRFAHIARPRTLTDHVQRRKLLDHDPRFPRMIDKVEAKDHVANLVGEDWIVPTLWQGTELPAEPAWPMPFAIKSRHGCGHIYIVRDAEDYAVAKAKAQRWLGETYGRWLDEWAYGQIPHGILVETFIGQGPDLPIDYKLFVFGGRVEFIQVHLDRATAHRWIVFDLDWRRVSLPTADPDPAPPSSLAEMILAAEKLGAGFDFVRVDLYEIHGRPLFGEMTFYPGSGLERVSPSDLDLQMGSLWSAARECTDGHHVTERSGPPSDNDRCRHSASASSIPNSAPRRSRKLPISRRRSAKA